MILQIDENAEEIYFPDPHYGDDDGCFAIGGDLSIDRLLLAYSNGIFPWYSFRDQPEILWFCPMKRFVIFPDEIHISHSMRTLLRKNRYSVGINEDFDAVIRACSKTNGRYEEDGAWLGENIIQAFTALHEQGFAASVEVWDNETGELVGGLYGLYLGGMFCGESMFSTQRDASKAALVALCEKVISLNGDFIDCQLPTTHLKSMCAVEISRDVFLEMIQKTLEKKVNFWK